MAAARVVRHHPKRALQRSRGLSPRNLIGQALDVGFSQGGDNSTGAEPLRQQLEPQDPLVLEVLGVQVVVPPVRLIRRRHKLQSALQRSRGLLVLIPDSGDVESASVPGVDLFSRSRHQSIGKSDRPDVMCEVAVEVDVVGNGIGLVRRGPIPGLCNAALLEALQHTKHPVDAAGSRLGAASLHLLTRPRHNM